MNHLDAQTKKAEAAYSEETKAWAKGLRISALARFSSRELIDELRRRGKRVVVPLRLPLHKNQLDRN